jgi:hypothetical protein
MKTIAYVDGYNLYQGLLRHSNYKWVDLVRLFEVILRKEDPTLELAQVKFFTAQVKARFSRHGEQAVTSQSRYHRALKALHGDRIDIHTGFFSDERAMLIRHHGSRAVDLQDRIPVWRIEEKQTDVRLSLEMYRDAVRGDCQCAVICSSDSDLVPAAERVLADTKTRVGIVLPRHYTADTDKRRPPNRSLTVGIGPSWAREYIHEDELKASLMPDRIGLPKKKPIDKPDYW